MNSYRAINLRFVEFMLVFLYKCKKTISLFQFYQELKTYPSTPGERGAHTSTYMYARVHMNSEITGKKSLIPEKAFFL